MSDRDANVVLTADVSGYTAGTQQAYQQTNALIGVVDKLAASMDGITKRAGKKLLLFSAADTAAIMGMVAISANYEKQLQSLTAQMAITGRGMQSYRTAISDAARAMPVARGEIVALTTEIAKLGVSSPRMVEQLTNNFIKLGAATGESARGLAAGMIELSHQMGTYTGGAKQMEKFSDSLAQVSANAGVSATSVVQFSQAIAPFARAAGIGETKLLGISTAFVKAGADGFAAGNTMNSMLADITRQVQSGSPEIAKYSNLIGVTVDQFKQMDPADRVVSIFEAINKQGPNAIKMLDRLGFDGIRAAKAIQTVANESGGLRKYINESMGAYGNGATTKGADAAFSGIENTMTKIRNNMEQVGESIGSAVVPVAEKLLQVFNSMLGAVNSLAGPLLAVGGALGAALAPLAGIGGVLASGMGIAGTVAMVATVAKASPLTSALQGFRAMRAERLGGAPVGPGFNQATDRYRAGTMPWHQRWGYQAGAAMGGALPLGAPAAGGNLLRAGLRMPFNLVSSFAGATEQFYKNAGLWNSLNRSSALAGWLGSVGTRTADLAAEGTSRVTGAATTAGRGMASFARQAVAHPLSAMGGFSRGWQATAGMVTAGSVRTMEAFEKAVQATTTSSLAASISTKAGATASQSLAQAAGGAAASLVRVGWAANKQLVSNTAQGVWGGVKAAGSGIAGALAGIGPLGLALGAGMGAYMWNENLKESKTISESDTVGIRAINTELGRATESVTSFADALDAATKSAEPPTNATASKVTGRDIALATGGREIVDKGVVALGGVDQFGAYLRGRGALDAEQLQQYKLDALGRGWSSIDVEKVLKDYVANDMETAGRPSRGSSAADIRQMVMSSAGLDSGWFSLKPTEDIKSANQSIIEAIDTSAASAPNSEAGAQKRMNLWRQAMGETFNASNGVTLNRSTEDLVKRLLKGAGMSEEEAQNFDVLDFQNKVGIDPNKMEAPEIGDKVVSYLIAQASSDPNSTLGKIGQRILGSGVAPYSGQGEARQKELYARPNDNPVELGIRSTALGAYARTNTTIWGATEGTSSGNPNERIKSMDMLANEAMKAGHGMAGAVKELEKLKAAVNDVNNPLYTLANATLDLLNSFQNVRRQDMGSTASWVDRTKTAQSMMNATGPEAETTRKEGQQQQMQVYTEITDRLRSFIQVAKNFKIQTQRAAEDYEHSVNLTNKNFYQQLEWQDADHRKQVEWQQADFYRSQLWAETDYQQQRKWTIEDYNRQIAISQRDFDKQMKYAAEDYNIAREREAKHFATSMRYMSEDAAKSMSDPWKRVQISMTASTGQLMSNLRQQNTIFKRQTEELNKLREMGMSQSAIDTLGLANPQMWAQVHRMVQTSTAQDIDTINQLIKERGAVADNLIMDPANNQALRRQLEERATMLAEQQADYEKTTARSLDAFKTSLKDMDDAFKKQSDRSLLLHKTQMERSTTLFNQQLKRDEELYVKSRDRSVLLHQQGLDEMKYQYDKAAARAKDDLHRWGEEITGNLTQLYKDAIALQADLLPGLGNVAIDAITRVKGQLPAWFWKADPVAYLMQLGQTGVNTNPGAYDINDPRYPYGAPQTPGAPIPAPSAAPSTGGNGRPTGTPAPGPIAGQDNALRILKIWMEQAGSYFDNPPMDAKVENGWGFLLSRKRMWFRVPKEFTTSWSLSERNGWWQDNAASRGFAVGGIVTRPTQALVGEAGSPEAIIPLNAVGASFMAKALGHITREVIQELRAAGGIGAPVHSTIGAGGSITIHNETTFRDITVQAQDPNAMARALQEKARLTNLRRGANAATANG